MNDGWVPALNSVNTAINNATNAIAAANTTRADRKFAREEAKKTRDWQEQIYQKYQSPQAQVNQLKAAGINPYLDGVETRSVGSGATASAPASHVPDYGSIGNSIMDALNAKRMLSEIESIDENTRSTYLDNVKKLFENGNLQEVYEYQIAELKADLKTKRLTHSEFEVRVKALNLAYEQAKEAADAGINPHVDAHNESVQRVHESIQRVAESEARTLTENMSRLPRIAQMRAKTALDNLAYELDDKYGRVIMKGEAKQAGLDFRKGVAELNEYLRGSEFRTRMLSAGADSAEIDALVKSYEALMSKFDYQYLRDMFGSDYGDDVTDPFALLIYAVANFSGLGINLFGNSK